MDRRRHLPVGRHAARATAVMLALCLLPGVSGCSAPRTPSLPWAGTSATVSGTKTGGTGATNPTSPQEDPLATAWTAAVNGGMVRSENCAPLAQELLASQTRFDARLGQSDEAHAKNDSSSRASGTGGSSSSSNGVSLVTLERSLLTQGLTTLALGCPAQAPAAAFALARLGPASLPSAARLRATASAMGRDADRLAWALDCEHFVLRFLRLSSPATAPSQHSGDDGGTTQEDLVSGLSDTFARPAVRAGKADPRQKIYSTASLDADSLRRSRTDPASGLPATNGQILEMDEARAAAAALPALIRSKASKTTKKTAVETTVFLARRAYEAGYPLSYPVLLTPGTNPQQTSQKGSQAE